MPAEVIHIFFHPFENTENFIRSENFISFDRIEPIEHSVYCKFQRKWSKYQQTPLIPSCTLSLINKQRSNVTVHLSIGATVSLFIRSTISMTTTKSYYKQKYV